MKEYNWVLSWTVIEAEIKRVAEKTGKPLKPRTSHAISTLEPADFQLETGTLWRFQRRGSWAVHDGDYRGNWPPQLVRNLLLRYTSGNDLVVDPTVGGGTTAIECALLQRPCVASDISPHSVSITRRKIGRLMALVGKQPGRRLAVPVIRRADARDLTFVKDQSAKLVCLHPPYGNLLRYTHSVKGDLSRIRNFNQYLGEVKKIASEAYRILRPDGFLAILIGDTRNRGNFEPLGFKVFEVFRNEGFTPETVIIKSQHHDRSTEFYVRGKTSNLLFEHEYLLVFRRS